MRLMQCQVLGLGVRTRVAIVQLLYKCEPHKLTTLNLVVGAWTSGQLFTVCLLTFYTKGPCYFS